jgi:inhibitor of KinA sporulation pathway (predicted exonuclease)
MLTGLGMSFEGRQHSGIDDSHNISRILKELAQLGHVFVNTTAIKT